MGTAILGILSGHRRYANINAVRGDGISPRLLGSGRRTVVNRQPARIPVEQAEFRPSNRTRKPPDMNPSTNYMGDLTLALTLVCGDIGSMADGKQRATTVNLTYRGGGNSSHSNRNPQKAAHCVFPG